MSNGYFGNFGGLFIPETLSHALNELDDLYQSIKDDQQFKDELSNLYRDYVGRPSPLYEGNVLAVCIDQHFHREVFRTFDDFDRGPQG